MVDGIREKYPLARTDGDGIRLVLGVNGVRVGLRVRAIDTFAGKALVFTAFLAPATRITPVAALAVNAHLVLGALTLYGSDLLLRSVLLVRKAGAAPVEHLEQLAAEAARIKRAFAQRPADQDVFDVYRE